MGAAQAAGDHAEVAGARAGAVPAVGVQEEDLAAVATVASATTSPSAYKAKTSSTWFRMLRQPTPAPLTSTQFGKLTQLVGRPFSTPNAVRVLTLQATFNF